MGGSPATPQFEIAAPEFEIAPPTGDSRPYAKPGPYVTKLPSTQESQFQGWVKQNKIPWQDSPTADYDMRGYWKAQQSDNPNAKRAENLHFPDTWKTPYHQTFSNESQYATKDAPHWEGNVLVDKQGHVVANENPGVPLQEPDYMQTEHPLTDWFTGGAPTPVSPEAKEEQANLEQFRKEQRAQRQRPSASELATGLASGVAEMFTAPTGGAVSTEAGEGAGVKRHITQVGTPGQRFTGALGLASDIAQAPAPAMGPAALEAGGSLLSALKLGAGVGSGMGASYGVGKVAPKLGANEEQTQLAQDLAFWMPSVAASLSGLKVSGADLPEVKGGGVGVQRPFGGAGAGVAVTPESVNIGGRVGPFKGSVSIPRNGAAAGPALDAPTIEGSQVDPASQALADHELIQQRAARVANGQPAVEPPPAPPTPKVTEITQDDIQHIAGLIGKLPAELRAQGLLEAHQTMARIIGANGKVVGPDGKLIVVDSPKAAEKAAADLVNDEVDRQDKARQESEKAKPAAKLEVKAEAPANRRGRQAQQAAIETKAFEVSEPEAKFEVAAPEKAEVESGDGTPANAQRVNDNLQGTDISKGTPVSGEGVESGASGSPAGTAGNAAVEPEGHGQPSEKVPFHKGQQVRFSKDFPVRKGQNQEVAETIPQGTPAYIEHAGEGMNFVRLRLADGRKISVNQRAIEAASQEKGTSNVSNIKESTENRGAGEKETPETLGRSEFTGAGSGGQQSGTTPEALSTNAPPLAHGSVGGNGISRHAAESNRELNKRAVEAGIFNSGSGPEPGEVGTMKVSDLKMAPNKFQYKLGTDAEGVSSLLKEQDKFKPDLAGVVSVWRDPADQKMYVVNGHHRFELAKRTGQKEVAVRHIVAPDAQRARSIGALQNIAEGRGTPVDAAKFFRDSNMTPERLKEEGVSLGEATGRQGLALSRLDTPLFNKVVSGDLRLGRAVAIGEATEDPAEQKAILNLVDKKEARGQKISDGVLSELIRFVKESGREKETTSDLFGSQEITKSLALGKAEISDYIRQQLSKDRKLFGFVSKEGRAQDLARAGNKIDVDKSKEISVGAQQAEEVYNRLSARGGDIADILDKSAKRLAGKENAVTVKSDAYHDVRAAVQKALSGGAEASHSGSQAVPRSGGEPQETAKPASQSRSSVESKPVSSPSGTGDKSTQPNQETPAGADFVDVKDERGAYRKIGNAVDVNGNWGRLKELPDDAEVVMYHATTEANAKKILAEGFGRGEKATNFGGDRDYTYLGGYGDGHGLGSYIGGATYGGKPVIVVAKVKKGLLEPDRGSDWKSHFKSNPGERQFAKQNGIDVNDPSAVDTYAVINQVRARNEHVEPLGIIDPATRKFTSKNEQSPAPTKGAEPTLPGMESVPAERAEANAEQQGKDLTAKLTEPPKSIESKAGEIEQKSPLFRDTEANPQESLFGRLHRDESGAMNIGPMVKAAETVHSFLKQEVEDTRRAKELQWEMYDLDKRHEGRVLRAKQLLEKLQDQGVTQEDRRAIDNHLDALEADSDSVPVPSLTDKQDEILDKVLLPLKEEAEAAFKKVTEGGMTIPNYNPRQTKGKGGMLDRFLTKQGQRWSGRGNMLSKQMPAAKHRVMMALENEDGERKIISIKGGQVTAWKDGQPENIGGLSHTQEGRAFEDSEGNIWTLKQATKNEIEQDSGVRYYHDAAASTIVNWLQAKKAEAAHDFIENFKHSTDFENIALKTGQGNPPKGWRTTNLPQFKGYYFEPHTAEVFDWFFDRLKSGDPDAFDSINSYMRAKITLNPIAHVRNVATQAFIQRGITGFLPNRMYRLGKMAARAINAVKNQNQDLVDAYEAGFPGQAARQVTGDLVKLFYEQLAEAAENGEPWATKAAKAIGFPPATLVRKLHELSSKMVWPASDAMFLQAAYEYQDTHPGASLKDAFREVGRIIPEYRLPVRIMNSTTIGKIMGSKWGTIFGAYHYGELRSFSESMKSAFGAGEERPGQSKVGDVAKGWDRLAAMALGLILLGGAGTKLVQYLTGEKDAEPTYPGILGLIHAVIRVGRKEESPAQVATKIVTPNPASLWLVQGAFNHDFRTGRQLYDPAAKWDVEGEQLMQYVKENAWPYGSEVERAKHTDQGWKKFWWNQAGANFPKHGAEALAQQIAASKLDTSAMTPEERDSHYARQKAVDALRRGETGALEEGIEKGQLTAADITKLLRRSTLSGLADKVHNFTFEELMRVYEKADDEQQEELLPLLMEKQEHLLEQGRLEEAGVSATSE